MKMKNENLMNETWLTVAETKARNSKGRKHIRLHIMDTEDFFPLPSNQTFRFSHHVWADIKKCLPVLPSGKQCLVVCGCLYISAACKRFSVAHFSY